MQTHTHTHTHAYTLTHAHTLTHPYPEKTQGTKVTAAETAAGAFLN